MFAVIKTTAIALFSKKEEIMLFFNKIIDFVLTRQVYFGKLDT